MWVKIDELAYVSSDGNAEITYKVKPGGPFVLGGGFWELDTDEFTEEFYTLYEAQRAYERYVTTGRLA